MFGVYDCMWQHNNWRICDIINGPTRHDCLTAAARAAFAHQPTQSAREIDLRPHRHRPPQSQIISLVWFAMFESSALGGPRWRFTLQLCVSIISIFYIVRAHTFWNDLNSRSSLILCETFVPNVETFGISMRKTRGKEDWTIPYSNQKIQTLRHYARHRKLKHKVCAQSLCGAQRSSRQRTPTLL